MADPLCILGPIATALVFANNARVFIESIRGAPDVVRELLEDLNDIQKPLHDLSKLIEASNLEVDARAELLPILDPAFQHCQKVTQDIQNALQPYVKPDREPNRNVWKRLSFTFKAEKIRSLQDELTRCKASLNMALNVSNMYFE